MAEQTELRLRVVTPTGTVLDTPCDGVRLMAADGSVGIRKGHLPALILLARGDAAALRGGETLATVGIKGGFATVENDVVTVLASGILPE